MSINIPWLEVLKACYPSARVSEDTEVLVPSPQYAADIAVIMSTTDRGSLNNYLVWRLVHKYMPYLSSAYTEVVTMYRKFLTGAQRPLERWEFCYDVTNQFFGHLMDALFYEQQVAMKCTSNTFITLFVDIHCLFFLDDFQGFLFSQG